MLATAVLAALVLAGTARADAAATYGAKCAVCHGKDGKGTPSGLKLGAKDLSLTKLSAADIEKLIAEGKPPKMTAFRGKISDAEIKALAAYVKAGLK
jgi:cytochrome c6